jgi:hypothetical protein
VSGRVDAGGVLAMATLLANNMHRQRLEEENSKKKSQEENLMRISDLSCPSCGSAYEMAESTSAEGSPGRAECSVCGGLLDSWQAPSLRAYRLVLSPERKYRYIVAPPPPLSAIVA